MGQRPLFILRCAWGATARDAEYNGGMDYRKSAQEVLDNVGGADNVVSAAHCATRLRLVIADNSKVNKEAIENVDGAKGVFEAQGQLQIIFGTGTVNKVYEEFIALSGVEAATKAEVKEAAAQQQNIFMRAIKVLGDVFVPIILAIVASGLLLGIMSAINFMASNGFIALDTNNFIYKIADLVSGTSFGILQILIGYSAAKAFGANPYLGAVVGGALSTPRCRAPTRLPPRACRPWSPSFPACTALSGSAIRAM